MATRAYWQGQNRLALVSIPVEIYPASKSSAKIPEDVEDPAKDAGRSNVIDLMAALKNSVKEEKPARKSSAAKSSSAKSTGTKSSGKRKRA